MFIVGSQGRWEWGDIRTLEGGTMADQDRNRKDAQRGGRVWSDISCHRQRLSEADLEGLTPPQVLEVLDQRIAAEHQRIEEERELVAELMMQLSSGPTLSGGLKNLTRLLQNWSGCEAVGVRLRRGEDYPYYETRGFPSAFVLSESSLCVCDAQGEIIRDSVGNPVLECMCGNVLRGKVDPAYPFFTNGGSFWSNNTTRLLADTTQEDRQARTRNRCNGEGYESVALVPLRTDNTILGLLQFNDHRPDRFSVELIAHFERIADTLALALAKRQTEEELLRSEEKFRTLAEFAYAMETWRLPDGTFRYVSHSCERVTGYPVEAFSRNPRLMEDIVHPDDHGLLTKHCRQMIEGEESCRQHSELEFRILAADGRTCWLSHSCIGIYGEDGTWLGCRESYRDITKRMEAEQEKQALEKTLRYLQKQQSLERMAGAIVHHFNNKLHVIEGYLQLSMETLPVHNSSRYNMAAALDAVEKCSEVSKLMLTYLGQTKGKRQPLDLAGICREYVRRLKSSLPKNVRLEIDLPSSGPVIETNETQIHQILAKLVTNARESTDNSEGLIRVAIDVVSAAEVPLTHRFPCDWVPEDTSYARLMVHDSGRGLSSEELESAFDPFYSTKFTGRGLGLPVVLGLAQAHKGGVTVESSPGAGSCFCVYFPLSFLKSASLLEARPVAEERTRAAGMALVVDDDEVVLEINSRLVSMLGYEVLIAHDGMEAVEVFTGHKDKIRFVLSDFAMPRLNGLEMASSLRKIAPDTPVILASGYSEDLVMGSGDLENPKYFLGKPFTLQELRDLVNVALYPGKTDLKET